MSELSVLKKWGSLAVFLCVLTIAGGPRAFGQATGGSISGQITDQKQGTVPGATVTVRNLDTNASHSLTTQDDGRFNFPGLPVGPYELTVERTGFAKYVRGPINLELNQSAVVNIELHTATVTETVRVTADAPLINTTSPEVGVRFDPSRVIGLPSSGQGDVGGGFRDVFSYALSAPGVSQLNSGNFSFANGTNFSVNGMRPRGNNFMIDGQDSNDPSVTGREQVLNNPEVVQEFRLITNQFAAEYGRAAGSVVNVVTKSGTKYFHGSAYWFHNDNALNSCSNLNKRTGLSSPKFCSPLPGGRDGAPFRIENQFGGTIGGPIWKNHTFFFGSAQRWTDRRLGSGSSIVGVPTDAGKALLQSTVGSRGQVAALLKFVPGAATQNPGAFASFCVNGGALPSCSGGQRVDVPTGTITGSIPIFLNNWQASGRIDHQFSTKHSLGGRYLFNDSDRRGSSDDQATPPGLSTVNPFRTQAMTVFLTSNFPPRTVNELRPSWQRLATVTSAADPASGTIPAIEVPQLGLTGFNANNSRTGIGLAVNLPQFRRGNTYQLQDNVSWNHGAHGVKFGIDFRRVDVVSFFVPVIRGELRYATTAPAGLPAGTVSIQNFIDDVADIAIINKPLPGGQAINGYKWYDYNFFVQDTWAVRPSLTLTLGLRYETPGNALASLFPLNDRIVAANGGQPVFQLNPRPKRDLDDFQPRVGFSWNPRTRESGFLGRITGGNKLVVRGGYSRTNDYQFINLALNVATSFPFVALSSNPGLTNAFATLPAIVPSLTDPAKANLLARTVVGSDFRTPDAEQFSLEIQRQVAVNNLIQIGYVGTKGTGLFQTIDGNPRTPCAVATALTTGCPRVNPNAGPIRLRANAGSSIYHSLQISYERRFANGFSAGAHYTWSAFIDSNSDTFNPSAQGEVAVAQDPFNRAADRGRSTYDRPHRFAMNAVYELPFFRSQKGPIGHFLGGWQIAGYLTFQSGSPFTPLNGSDPFKVDSGIDSFVGSPLRPNLNTTLAISQMSIPELLAANAASIKATGTGLFSPITKTSSTRIGNVGRNVLRSNKLKDADISIVKTTRLFGENHKLQFRADFFNLTNTRNFGIPSSDVSNPKAFLDQGSTDGGNRRIFLAVRYAF